MTDTAASPAGPSAAGPTRASWPARATMAVGWTVLVVGVAGVLGGIPHFVGEVPWWDVVRWTVGLALVHDLVVAPVVCLVGLGVGRLPRVAQGPVAAALVVSASVVAVTYPAWRGFGRVSTNPSILPNDYGTGLLVVLGLVWAAAVGVLAARVVTGGRSV